MGRERAMVIPHTNIPRNLCFACFCVKVRLGKHSGGSWVAFTHQSVSHTWLNLRNDISLGVWVAGTSGITRSRHSIHHSLKVQVNLLLWAGRGGYRAVVLKAQ